MLESARVGVHGLLVESLMRNPLQPGCGVIPNAVKGFVARTTDSSQARNRTALPFRRAVCQSC